jgi:hypothetical protein
MRVFSVCCLMGYARVPWSKFFHPSMRCTRHTFHPFFDSEAFRTACDTSYPFAAQLTIADRWIIIFHTCASSMLTIVYASGLCRFAGTSSLLALLLVALGSNLEFLGPNLEVSGANLGGGPSIGDLRPTSGTWAYLRDLGCSLDDLGLSREELGPTCGRTCGSRSFCLGPEGEMLAPT